MKHGRTIDARRLWRALCAAVLCLALLGGAVAAVSEEEIILANDTEDEDILALELDEIPDVLVEDLPELDLDADIALGDDLTVPESGALELSNDGEADSEGEAPADPTQTVPLVAKYTGGTLTKVYDCNKYGQYEKDGQLVYIIGELETIRDKFSFAPAEGYDWVDGHRAVDIGLTLSRQFDSADVGSYEFEFTVTLTGDDAAWYTLEESTVKVPATITQREVVVTPRAGLYKVYGTKDPAYPDNSWLSQDESSPLHQDVSGVPGYGVPVNIVQHKLQLTVTNAAYILQDAKNHNEKFFRNDGWLSRKSGEKVGKYKITIGDLSFGKNFKVTLKDDVFTITAKNIADANVTVKAIGNQKYTGKAIELDKDTLVVEYGTMTLKKGVDYTVTYSNNTEPSTDSSKAKVTLTGKGNFTGTREVSFSIVRTGKTPVAPVPTKQKITDPGVTVGSIAAKTYTGKAITPSPVVKYNGKKLKKGTDYTLSYKNNKNPGKATITITGKGKYTGSRKVTFKIVLQPAAISKLTAGKGKVTVAWKKRANVTGYQVACSQKSSFSSQYTERVKGNKKTKLVVEDLKSGKTYYFRIRTYKTVNGKTYWSAWSKSKKVKVK